MSAVSRRSRSRARGALVVAVILCLLSLALTALSATRAAGAMAEVRPSSVSQVPLLVKFKPGASDADTKAAVDTVGGVVTNTLKQIRTKVIYVSPEARDRILGAYQHHPSVERATAAIKLSKAGTPSDPDYAQQWALPKIAWDQAYGVVPISGTATIAVLDTGIDVTHPDLAGRVVSAESFIGGNPIADPNGHGTALAGIAAANVNDGIGMAGVAYAGANLSSVQVLQADGTGYDSDVVAGVLWAADHGANVILMGFSSADYSAALAEALAYAWSNGAVLVAATGNDGSSAPTYPAGMANVIGVASTDQSDTLASNTDTTSALAAAPGVSIYATRSGGGYTSLTGSSASAAEAAGLAALLVADRKTNDEAATQIRGA